jgi:hypothetical protein
MSSDEENDDLNYGLDDDEQNYVKGVVSKSLSRDKSMIKFIFIAKK